jgi:hypothetical protein
MYDYSHQFNNLAQYGAHHVDMDVKKAKLFCKGLTIQLQDRLVLSPNLSYNELVSAEAKERKRKRIIPICSGSGQSSGAPLKYHMVHTPPTGQSRRCPQYYRGNRS